MARLFGSNLKDEFEEAIDDKIVDILYRWLINGATIGLLSIGFSADNHYFWPTRDMIVKSADFIMSNSFIKGCQIVKTRYTFIGRFNVGKSSLINMLCQRKNLARISGYLGKTRLINHFEINKCWYLLDAICGYRLYQSFQKHQIGVRQHHHGLYPEKGIPWFYCLCWLIPLPNPRPTITLYVHTGWKGFHLISSSQKLTS